MNFGAHPSDNARALKALKAARADGATLDDVQDSIVSHVLSAGATNEHIRNVVVQLVELLWDQLDAD